MFYRSPLLLFYMVFDGVLRLVYREPDNSHFISPVFASFKHLLVMLHRFLTRWAPSSPEIEEDDLPCFMGNVNHTL